MLNNIFHSVPPSRGSVNFIWAQLYTVVDTVRCRRWAIPGFTGRRGRSAAGRRRAGSHRYRLDRPTLRPGGSATPGSWAYTGAGGLTAPRRADGEIEMAQVDLHDTLEKMIEALDDGTPIDTKLYQEAMEQIQELEVQANSLRKDLKKLQK